MLPGQRVTPAGGGSGSSVLTPVTGSIAVATFCAPGSTREQELAGRGIHRLEDPGLANGDHGLAAAAPGRSPVTMIRSKA